MQLGNGFVLTLFPNDPKDFFRLPGGAIWRYERIGVLVTVLVITGDYSPMARTELMAGNWEPSRMTLTGGIVANPKPTGGAKPASAPKPAQ